MHLSRHLLCVRVIPTGQLLQIQAEVARHDTWCREIGQTQAVQDAYGAHHPALNFFQRDRPLRVRKPLVLVKHRLHQRRGKVAAQVEHTVVP